MVGPLGLAAAPLPLAYRHWARPGALAASGAAFVPAAKLVVIAHLPVMAVEGVVTAAAVSLLVRVKPDAFWRREAPSAPPLEGRA